MTKKSDSEKLLGLCTVYDLIDELSSRVPALVVGALVPDDGDVCDTVTYTNGNRSSCLGLATLLRHNTLKKLARASRPLRVEDHESDSGTSGG